ncbi:hypothetical protein FBU59_000158 [Linderina macrospora]|uniref:Uncharacterized protein n=1 Tax=Linderina macrospora TaxID=4868 RepID=A0ACC1JHT3_9FUNG|nr:hypothetical protein FBU59_000158 [Linderina macrospora]
MNPGRSTVLATIGGWAFNDPGPTEHRFSDLIAKPDRRNKFNDAISKWIEQGLADGLDIDFEYPTSDEHGGRKPDYDNYLTWIKELRGKIGKASLSIAAPASPWYLRGFRIDEMAEHLDYIVFMTYDLHGVWDKNIKSLGAYLNPHTNMTEIKDALKIIERAGVPSNKIMMGIGFYGRGYISYGEIKDMVDNRQSYHVQYDDKALVNIMLYGYNDYVSYDNEMSLKAKLKEAKDMCLGGVSIWALDLDDRYGSLITAISGLPYRPLDGSDGTDTFGEEDEDDEDVFFDFFEIQDVGDISDDDFLNRIKDKMTLRDKKYMRDDFWDTVFDEVNSDIGRVGGLAPERIYQLYLLAGSRMMQQLIDAAKKDLKDQDMTGKWQKKYQKYMREQVDQKLADVCYEHGEWFTCKDMYKHKSKKCPKKADWWDEAEFMLKDDSDSVQAFDKYINETLGLSHDMLVMGTKFVDDRGFYCPPPIMRVTPNGTSPITDLAVVGNERDVFGCLSAVNKIPGLMDNYPPKTGELLTAFINSATASLEDMQFRHELQTTDINTLYQGVVQTIARTQSGNDTLDQFYQYREWVEEKKKESKFIALFFIELVVGAVLGGVIDVAIGLVGEAITMGIEAIGAARAVATIETQMARAMDTLAELPGIRNAIRLVDEGAQASKLVFRRAWESFPKPVKALFRRLAPKVEKAKALIKKHGCDAASMY